MKQFNSVTEMVNEKAHNALSSYFRDTDNEYTFSELKQEIIKERAYQLKKVKTVRHPYIAKTLNVPLLSDYIESFGYVSIN